MSLTENGLGVADSVRGIAFEHRIATGDRTTGIPDLHEDGFCLRNSCRPDLYPYAPQVQGASHALALRPAEVPAHAVTGRLDEVTADAAAEKAAAAEVPAMQLAPAQRSEDRP